jgi:DNA invertase Pin-like site-specific DNA recombinase
VSTILKFKRIIWGFPSEGRYRGRPRDLELHKKIEGMLLDKKSYGYIQHILNCSRTTISKISKKLKQEKLGT